MKFPPWLLNGLVILITAVWVTNFVAGLVLPSYSPPESVNLVFSSMVGTLLIVGHRNRDGDDD